MSVIVGNVKNYKISATGTASDIDASDDGIDRGGWLKVITAGTDVHILIGKGDATTDDFLLQANHEVIYDTFKTRVSAKTEGSSSAVYVAVGY